MFTSFLFAFILITSTDWEIFVSAYNRPSCTSWPTADVWQSELGSKLSPDASLIGISPDGSHDVVVDYVSRCSALGSNPYLLAQNGDGVCMQAPECAYQFCNASSSSPLIISDEQANWPSYVVRVRTVEDISVALEFANQHDIVVSVKTTGHSWQGSSTQRHSLLIWMAHFLPDSSDIVGQVRAVTDSCGTTYPTTIGLGGGQMWDDVIQAVQGNYHLVTGGCRSVSAAGGWLQGVGMSFTSRRYGLGVDQVVRFHVVLPDGTPVVADACSEEYSDLFWALRGGGGGTFGIVTHADYQVHPTTPIAVIEFLFDVEDVIARGRSDLILLWLQFWIQVSTSPTLLLNDTRWSGFFNGGGVHLTFVGTQDEAMSLFGNALAGWYATVFAPQAGFEGDWFIGAPFSWEASSWYEYRGGVSAFRDPVATVQTGPEYNGFAESFGARLIPLSLVRESPTNTANFLLDLTLNGTLSFVSYFLGGNINSIPEDETAVHPAMRNAIYHIAVEDATGQAHAALREFAPNTVTGVSYNHHYVLEPDWKEASWGVNYERLLSIKSKYDPNHRLNCWHCVGYIGPESDDSPPYVEPPCPLSPIDDLAPTVTPSSSSPTKAFTPASPSVLPTSNPTSSTIEMATGTPSTHTLPTILPTTLPSGSPSSTLTSTSPSYSAEITNTLSTEPSSSMTPSMSPVASAIPSSQLLSSEPSDKSPVPSTSEGELEDKVSSTSPSMVPTKDPASLTQDTLPTIGSEPTRRPVTGSFGDPGLSFNNNGSGSGSCHVTHHHGIHASLSILIIALVTLRMI